MSSLYKKLMKSMDFLLGTGEPNLNILFKFFKIMVVRFSNMLLDVGSNPTFSTYHIGCERVKID